MHKEAVGAQKQRTGLNRIVHAFGYSVAGLRAGWSEVAFRQEAMLAVCLVPLAFFVGTNRLEVAFLCAVVVWVLVVELLNTGIETAIDRIGPEWHALSKRAKDMGSAAVLLSLLLALGIWTAAIAQRLDAGFPATRAVTARQLPYRVEECVAGVHLPVRRLTSAGEHHAGLVESGGHVHRDERGKRQKWDDAAHGGAQGGVASAPVKPHPETRDHAGVAAIPRSS